jgi:hypothetical protein
VINRKDVTKRCVKYRLLDGHTAITYLLGNASAKAIWCGEAAEGRLIDKTYLKKDCLTRSSLKVHLQV